MSLLCLFESFDNHNISQERLAGYSRKLKEIQRVAGASIACNGKLFLANFSVLCVDVPDARNCDNSIRLVRGVCWGVQGSQSPGWSVHLQPLSASIHHPLLAIPTPTIPFRLPPLAGLRRYSISIHSLPAAEAILLKKLFNSSNCYWSMKIFPHSFSCLPREMGISVKASILAGGVQPGWSRTNQVLAGLQLVT